MALPAGSGQYSHDGLQRFSVVGIALCKRFHDLRSQMPQPQSPSCGGVRYQQFGALNGNSALMDKHRNRAFVRLSRPYSSSGLYLFAARPDDKLVLGTDPSRPAGGPAKPVEPSIQRCFRESRCTIVARGQSVCDLRAFTFTPPSGVDGAEKACKLKRFRPLVLLCWVQPRWRASCKVHGFRGWPPAGRARHPAGK